MSVKNVMAFYDKVEEDKPLQAKLKVALKNAEKDPDSGVGELVQIAKSEGFSFSSQDLFKTRSKRPLSQQRRELVSKSAFEVVDKDECTLEGGCIIEWPDCVEANASCVIADPCQRQQDLCGTPPD